MDTETQTFLIDYARERWANGANPARLLLELRDLFPCSTLTQTFQPVLEQAGVMTKDSNGVLRLNRSLQNGKRE